MSSSVPTVGERLRFSLVMCHALKACALLVDIDPQILAPGHTPREILQLFPTALDSLFSDIEATQAALSAESLGASAPPTWRAR